MKQIVQNYNTGDLRLEDVPTPLCRKGHVLVRTEFSVVSTGTERMKVSQARMNLLQKAKARPDKVKQVLQSIVQVGLSETIGKVQERLDSLTPLGYSSSGLVIEVGEGIDSISVGDRVACAGEGVACHAEYVSVPRNLCAKIPDNVAGTDAAFATVGAIAMNGVRQANVAVGDTVLVIGLGLVGLLAVQLLAASGCRVFGVDIDAGKIDLAKKCGADAAFTNSDTTLGESILELTNHRGVDAVYIAASTNRTDPMDLAGELVRDRGTVIVVGMIPVHAEWQTYYNKELNIVMARSYGAGRYDRNYEDKGIDYPVGYVPWTERRNLEEFLRLVGTGAVSPTRLGPKEFAFEDAKDAYEEIHKNPGQHAVGVVFRYSGHATPKKSVRTDIKPARTHDGDINLALIGAGNFATGTLIPAMKLVGGINLHSICSARGLNAKSAANRHGFSYAVSDASELFQDESVQAVVIATRHDSHAQLAIDSLNNGKHTFVEKPLALNTRDLELIIEAQEASGRVLLPGFNRRFSPLSEAVRDFFSESAGPLEVVCRINAGPLGKDSWYQDSQEGGWRIVSEGCHFIDLISFVTRSEPKAVHGVMISGNIEGGQNDNCIATLTMENGSIATLIYVANGDPTFEKERIEVFGQGRTATINNWRSATLSQGGKSKMVSPKGSGKGHKRELLAFVEGIRSGVSPISARSAYLTSLATLKIVESLQDSSVKELL